MFGSMWKMDTEGSKKHVEKEEIVPNFKKIEELVGREFKPKGSFASVRMPDGSTKSADVWYEKIPNTVEDVRYYRQKVLYHIEGRWYVAFASIVDHINDGDEIKF